MMGGISDMRLFRKSSHLKFGKQSNNSSGNAEMAFPSRYKNWKQMKNKNVKIERKKLKASNKYQISLNQKTVKKNQSIDIILRESHYNAQKSS